MIKTIDGRAVRVRLVSGLTVFGLCAALSGEYSDDFLPSVSHAHFYIEIFRPLEINPADPSKPTSPAFEPEKHIASLRLFFLS